jgi:uncharacterized protein DUF5681
LIEDENETKPKNQERKMADYKVGYKKPPRHSQFKPGNRANPHGRGKRKQRTEAEIVYDVMNGPAEFRQGGKSKRAPRIELLIKSYGAAALKGDVSAAEALLKIRENFIGIPPSNQSLYSFPSAIWQLPKPNTSIHKERSDHQKSKKTRLSQRGHCSMALRQSHPQNQRNNLH